MNTDHYLRIWWMHIFSCTNKPNLASFTFSSNRGNLKGTFSVNTPGHVLFFFFKIEKVTKRSKTKNFQTDIFLPAIVA